MNKENITIHIFPDINVIQLQGFDINIYGKEFSTSNELKLHKVSNGFSILYKDKEFEKLNTTDFTNSLYQMLVNVIGKETLKYTTLYYYPLNQFSERCGVKVISISNMLTLLNRKNNDFIYNKSESVEYLIKHYDEDEDDGDKFDFTESSNNYTDDEDEEDIYDTYDDIEEFLGINNINSNKKKRKKKSYVSSKILKHAKNSKRTAKRHGVVIYNDKRDLKQDKKIIKEMLEDFIPGKSGWIKDFREEVLIRWIRAYTISKKNFNRVIKEYKRAKSVNNNKRTGTFGKITEYLSQSILNNLENNDDTWNNPRR